ncbi:hypothetical protein PMAYCL1PPCAC_13857, partial [Pristionchus mayeri]
FSLDPVTIEIGEDPVHDPGAESELIPLGGEVAELVHASSSFRLLENALNVVLDEVGELVVELLPDEIRFVLHVCALLVVIVSPDEVLL